MVSLKIDGDDRQVPEGTTLREHAPPDALVARVGDALVDLDQPVDERLEGAEVVFPAPDDPQVVHVLRHSAAHILAQAVLRLFPDAKYAIGPPITDPPGFYYDFDLPRPLTEEDLESIEQEMAKVIAEDQPFLREELSRADAVRLFTDFDQPYKREILEGGSEEGQVKVGEAVSLYRNDGAFTDLCLGPHVPSTGHVRHVKLLRVSGAYWRGDETRPQLQRVYGTAWPTATELEAYLHQVEEAQKRDHRRLGRELDLFSSPDEVGSGLFVWHPKGGMFRKILEDYSRDEHIARGYDIVATPHLGRQKLFEISGHLEKYEDNMFPAMEAEEGKYYVKPMNCPLHALIYRSKLRSYRDLPLRFSELGHVYRHERSGTLNGLLRVRGMTQDDAHIFCRSDQLVDEILGVMEMAVEFYRPFGLTDPKVELSTKPGKAIGSPEMWSDAEEVLRTALDRSPYDYSVATGEGAFYGPKADFHFRDAIGRHWQLTTVQVDFSTPDRFELEYIGADNTAHRPVMIHRALYGSVERFSAVLVEHAAGAFPPWLAPVQARMVPLKDAVVEGARGIAERLRGAGLRVDVDDANETMNYKVRRGTLERIPWMLIVGPRELDAGTVSVRTRTGEDRRGVPLDDFIAEATAAVAERTLDV